MTPVAGIEDKNLFIDGQAIAPGEERVIGVRVGSLPSDTNIYINIFVYRSVNPGPVVLVLAGMHGDEVNGVEIIREANEMGVFRNLQKGSVIAIPLLNVYGFINFSRDLPDGKDVNRSFPGNSRGSLASRVANIVSKRVLPAVDFGIDFHTGGASRYNYPQVRYSPGSEAGLDLARQFGTKYILKKAIIKKSLRSICRKMGIPIIVYEGGEALRRDDFSTFKGIEGIKNVLAANGMITGHRLYDREMIHIQKTSWLRAARSGILHTRVSAGMPVTKGQQLGIITDPYNSRKTVIQAHRTGHVIGHNNAPVVNMGDALFSIGYDADVL